MQATEDKTMDKKGKTLREILEKLQRNIFDIAMFLIFIYCILQLLRIHAGVDQALASFMGGNQ